MISSAQVLKLPHFSTEILSQTLQTAQELFSKYEKLIHVYYIVSYKLYFSLTEDTENKINAYGNVSLEQFSIECHKTERQTVQWTNQNLKQMHQQVSSMSVKHWVWVCF